MKPPAKWNMSAIEDVSKQYSNSIPLVQLYALMNMLYSHYSDILGSGDDEESVRKYVQMAQKWYYDEDSNIDGNTRLYLVWKMNKG